MANIDLRSLSWITSSYSGNTGNCVEVASLSDAHFVRDTKDRDGGTLAVNSTAWSKFLDVIKSDRIDG